MTNVEIFEELKTLSQFIPVSNGVLNILTGCKVTCIDASLELQWGERVLGMASGGGSTHRIFTETNLEKFISLMRIQSKQYHENHG